MKKLLLPLLAVLFLQNCQKPVPERRTIEFVQTKEIPEENFQKIKKWVLIMEFDKDSLKHFGHRRFVLWPKDTITVLAHEGNDSCIFYAVSKRHISRPKTFPEEWAQEIERDFENLMRNGLCPENFIDSLEILKRDAGYELNFLENGSTDFWDRIQKIRGWQDQIDSCR